MKNTWMLGLLLVSFGALAKLPAPAPLSDEAKAKAEEAKAKAAHATKVDNYKLCKSMDVVAAHYAKTAGAKATKPSDKAPACVDPGPFVAAGAAAPAPAAAAKAPAKKS
jgi:hypothetical protein